MKQFIFLSLCITFFSTAVAQRNKIDIGVEGSASSILLYDNYPQVFPFERSIGYSVAATLQYNFPRILSIRTNVAYEKKGATYEIQREDSPTPGMEQFDLDFDYISVPLLLRATLGNKVQFFVNAGPFLGYLLKQEVRYRRDDISTTYDQKDSYLKLDAGIAAGAGLRFRARKKFIFSLEIRHNGGLKNIVMEEIGYPNDHKMKTIATNLLIGVCYRFGERK